VNLPSARHAFDALDDNPITRQMIAQTLDFLKAHARRDLEETITAGVPVGLGQSRRRIPRRLACGDFCVSASGRPEPARTANTAQLRERPIGGGQYARAIAEYERALTLGNGNVGWISYSAAAACMKLGDNGAAMRWIEKLEDIEPMWKRAASDDVFAPLRSNPGSRRSRGPFHRG